MPVGADGQCGPQAHLSAIAPGDPRPACFPRRSAVNVMPGSRASICISPFYGSAAMVAKRTLDKLRVLIIEDDPDFAAQLRIMLERSAGIRRVECCETLLCALTRLHAEPGDLAFLDLHLPDSEDLETLHRVRALYPALPIVVLTAREDDDLGDAAIRIGAQDYVVKHRLRAEILPRLLRNALTRARLEEALQRSEQRGRALFEHGLGLLCAHDLEGRLLGINPAAAHALGFSPEALVGRLLAELMPDAMRPRLKDYLRRIRRAGEAEGVFPVLTRGGEQRRWQFRNRLLTAEPEPYVLGFAIDVTDQIAAAERLGEQHAELTAIQQVLPLGLVRLDPMGAALDANPAFARIMGRPLAELLGDGWAVRCTPRTARVSSNPGRPSCAPVLVRSPVSIGYSVPMAKCAGSRSTRMHFSWAPSCAVTSPASKTSPNDTLPSRAWPPARDG